MADELIDIVDENNNLTNRIELKSKAHRENLPHRTSHVWIYNSKGEILLQLRAKDKLLYPNMWDISAAGHIAAGEKPILSALRETEEEIGINLEKKDFKLWKIRRRNDTYKNIIDNEFN